MKTRNVFLSLAVSLLISAISSCGAGDCIPAWAQEKLKQAQSNETPIEFYGRVIDQFNEPVGGAEVKAHVQQVGILYVWEPPPVNYLVKTDTQGRFVIPPKGTKVTKGLSLHFDDISRDGYELARDENFHRSYEYAKGNRTQFVPDKSSPVVFHMRKKGANPAFLFEEASLKFQVAATESGKAIGYDFVQRGRIRDVANPAGDDAALVCDLQVKATFNTNDATWTVVLSPGDTNGGIIVSEQLLYEAPDTGYQPEYTFTPEDRRPMKARYVYLRSRDPAIFTRLEIEHINANKDFFRLSGKSVTNPYGERNLEQATDLPYEVMKQLTDDVKTSFRQNKRPLKPDLPKLIKEAKDKADKDKSKQ